MAVTVSLYNHTARLLANGSSPAADTFRVMLCTSATLAAANTTLAGITKAEVATANGYTAGGAALANVTISTVTTNDARFDADDATWSATGGAITASYAIVYNDSDADDPPLAFIDFGESRSASAGTDFKVVWSTNGIFEWTVA